MVNILVILVCMSFLNLSFLRLLKKKKMEELVLFKLKSVHC